MKNWKITLPIYVPKPEKPSGSDQFDVGDDIVDVYGPAEMLGAITGRGTSPEVIDEDPDPDESAV